MAQRPENARRIRELIRQFRRAALSVRIPFLRRFAYWTAYLGLARRGVMLHSPTHDAVYQDGFWKRRYVLRTADELPLATFELQESFARQEARLVLEDGVRRRPDLAAVLALASALVFAPKRHSS